jgi:hypothetical protein
VTTAEGGSALDTVRSELAELDATPTSARVEVFDRVNRVLAAELAELDEV